MLFKVKMEVFMQIYTDSLNLNNRQEDFKTFLL